MANANLFQQYLQPARSVVDYSNDYAKADALKNQNAIQALSLQQAGDVQNQRNAFRSLVGSGADLNDAATQAHALSIAPDVAPGLLKTVQDSKTSAAKANLDNAQAGGATAIAAKTTQDTSIAAHQQHLQALSMVNTPQDAVQWMIDGVKGGILPQQGLPQALQSLQDASTSPDGFAKWKAGVQQSGIGVQQQLEMTAAKPTEVRLGNTVKMIDMNPRSQTFGKEVVQAQPIGQSPDNAATTGLGYSRLAEDETHNRATEANSNGQVTYQTDANGNMVAVPSRVAPGTTVQGQAVVDSSGKVIPGKSNLTETQGKATTFAARMADADAIINALEKKGVSGSDLRTIAAGSGLTNWAASPEGQQYRQAQENWVTANLRQESGAAIGKDEMAKDVRKFFPAPGDALEVKAQKAQARAVAQQGMVVQAGPGANQIPRILSSAGAKPAALATAAGWKIELVK